METEGPGQTDQATQKGCWDRLTYKPQCSDCSSTNLGFPLKTCLRICAIIGMISSLLYIIAGTSLITHISHSEKAAFSSMEMESVPQNEAARNIYYQRNVGFFIGIAVVLVLLNTVQFVSDAMLLHSTLKKRRPSSLWIYMMLDITLWIMTLVCFITIFSGGGLFLLLVFLMGTGVRAYITFILHEFISEEAKIEGTTRIHQIVLDLESEIKPTPVLPVTPTQAPEVGQTNLKQGSEVTSSCIKNGSPVPLKLKRKVSQTTQSEGDSLRHQFPTLYEDETKQRRKSEVTFAPCDDSEGVAGSSCISKGVNEGSGPQEELGKVRNKLPPILRSYPV